MVLSVQSIMELRTNNTIIILVIFEIQMGCSDLLSSFGRNYKFINIINMDSTLLPQIDEVVPRTYFTGSHLFIKFKLGSNFITFVTESPIKDYQPVFDILKFNEDSKIVIISRGNFSTIEENLRMFYDRKFLNVIVFDVNNNKIWIFDCFPEFKIKEIKTLDAAFPNKIRNIHGHPIKVRMYNGNVKSFFTVNKNNETVFLGYFSHIFENFARFINGVFNPVTVPVLNILDIRFLQNGEVDFISFMRFLIDSQNRTENMILNQNKSDTLLFSKMYIAVPTPGPLSKEFYALKPFTLTIYLLIVALVFYSAGMISLAMVILKEKVDFWYYFGTMEGCILIQSYPERKSFPKSNRFYIQLVIFSLIVTNWYSAILGSFLTTVIREPPINTMDDVLRRNLTLLVPEQSLYVADFIDEFRKYLHLFKGIPINEYFDHYNALDTEYGFGEASDHWHYFVEPQMKFYNDKRFKILEKTLGLAHLFINLNHDSIYKASLNRFIHLSKDTGLLEYWCSNIFYENLKYKVFNTSIKDPFYPSVQVLQINFFKYIFLGLGVGLSLTLVIFLLEFVI